MTGVQTCALPIFVYGRFREEARTCRRDRKRYGSARPATNNHKVEVKAAIESLFKVTVDAVNVVNIAGKQKRFGRGMGRRRNIRKAYVSLAAGQEINFAETK